MYPETVTPKGWLREYLQTQMQGLTGHIEKAGYPYDRQFWGIQSRPAEEGKLFWWPFEQTAYHIDGYTRAAILLRDGARIAKAKRMIYSVIDHPDPDGYLGPRELKATESSCTRWPHVVFFRACLAMYDYNRDARILEAMTRHYLGSPADHTRSRNALNIEIMLELYRHNGDRRLLEMAVQTYQAAGVGECLGVTDDALKPVREHGVTYNEFAKLGALLYRCTGEEAYLRCSIRAYQKVFALYALPGGCMSSSEFTRNNRYDETYETCDIADMTWSLHYLAEICDDITYSDQIEKCVFNAGIGSVLEDFRALQYFSCANQLVTDGSSSHAFYETGNGAMRYAPMPFTACCPGNVNRILPNFIQSMWNCRDDVVTARMYGPSTYTCRIGNRPVSITQETAYPFDLSMAFQIKTGVPFVLRLRVPGWCKGYTLHGAPYREEKGFLVVDITGSTGLKLTLEAGIRQEETCGGVYFTRGPLVYSLGMKGSRSPRGDAGFPEYSIWPDKPWNYAIVGSGAPEFRPGREAKWDLDAGLPSICVDARQVSSWKLVTKNKIISRDSKYVEYERSGQFTLLPPLPDMETAQLDAQVSRIALYPYGACKVRMTVLPRK